MKRGREPAIACTSDAERADEPGRGVTLALLARTVVRTKNRIMDKPTNKSRPEM